MKKCLMVVAVVLLSCLMLMALATAEPVFAFENLAYEVNVKKTLELKPILQGAELTGKAVYTWESDDPEIATVNNKGKVTGVGPGTTTVRVSVEDEAGVSFSTSCEIHVVQMVEKIVFEEKEVEIAAFKRKALSFKVIPENATNPELKFTSSNPDVCWVHRAKGEILGGLGTNESCYITAEAMDGSGVKQKVKVNVHTFIIPDEDKHIEITERKTYYLYLDGLTDGTTWIPDSYNFKYPKTDVAYLGNHNGGGRDNNYWFSVGQDPDNREKYMLRIEPYKKAGKVEVTFYDTATTWGRGFTKEKIEIVVKPSAIYGKEAFPPMNYEAVMADPAAYTGQDTQLTGTITSVEFTKKGSQSVLRFFVATKGKDGNPVACRIVGKYAKVLEKEYKAGDKVTVYGAWEEPEEVKTETGLTMTSLLLNIERINDDILNMDMVMQRRQ